MDIAHGNCEGGDGKSKDVNVAFTRGCIPVLQKSDNLLQLEEKLGVSSG